MKKLIIVLLLVLSLGIFLVGCGEDSGSSTPTSENVYKFKEAKITFSSAATEDDKTKANNYFANLNIELELKDGAYSLKYNGASEEGTYLISGGIIQLSDSNDNVISGTMSGNDILFSQPLAATEYISEYISEIQFVYTKK